MLRSNSIFTPYLLLKMTSIYVTSQPLQQYTEESSNNHFLKVLIGTVPIHIIKLSGKLDDVNGYSTNTVSTMILVEY